MAFKAHLAVAFLLVTFFISDVKPNETSHQYVEGEEVVLWRNSYSLVENWRPLKSFDTLALCLGPKPTKNFIRETKCDLFGSVASIDSCITIKFGQNQPRTDYCQYSCDNVARLIPETEAAIRNSFSNKMIVDDLVNYARIGEFNELKNTTKVYTHLAFNFFHFNNTIVGFEINNTEPVAFEQFRVINFSYEVTWTKKETYPMQREPASSRLCKVANFLYSKYDQTLFGGIIIGSYVIVLIFIVIRKRKQSLEESHQRLLLGDRDDWTV